MKKTLCWLMAAFSMILSGCRAASPPPDPPFCRVVAAVIIHADNTPESRVWCYTDPGKMTKALYYLRQVNSWERLAVDPAAIEGVRYGITLLFSDGSKKNFEQIDHACFRDADGIWYVISREYGLRLALLLAAVPSDAI